MLLLWAKGLVLGIIGQFIWAKLLQNALKGDENNKLGAVHRKNKRR